MYVCVCVGADNVMVERLRDDSVHVDELSEVRVAVVAVCCSGLQWAAVGCDVL